MEVDQTTVRRYVCSQPWGVVAFKRPVKPVLSGKNVEDRLRCCNWWKDKGYAEDSARGRQLRNNILFTDESWIELTPASNKQNDRIRTENPDNVQPKLRPKKGAKVIGGWK